MQTLTLWLRANQAIERKSLVSAVCKGGGIKLLTFVLIAASATAAGQLQPADQVARSKVSSRASSCAQPPNTTMVAWYTFDEFASQNQSGDIAMGNIGAWSKNPPVPVPGMVGNALSFNGVDQYVEAPSTIVTNFGPGVPASVCLGSGQGDYSACTGDFSIDVWINVPAGFMPGYAPVIVAKIATNRGYSFRLQRALNGLELQLFDGKGGTFGGGTNYFSPTLGPLQGTGWHHIAVTVQRSIKQGITWYHNGHCVENLGACVTSDPTDRTGSLTNDGPLIIGALNGRGGVPFQGDLDELDIYNRVLTPDEVLTIYNAGSAGKCQQ